jgi:hypothetical protein
MSELPMLRFQVSVHGRSDATPLEAALSVSFDAVFVQLPRLPRFFIELDGSFVWRGKDADGGEWQVDGNLIDRGDVLAYVELNGCCPGERLDELLRAVGWPGQALAFQLARRGVVLEEAEFRRQAAAEAGAI